MSWQSLHCVLIIGPSLFLLFSVQFYEVALFAVEDVDSFSNILVSVLQSDFSVEAKLGQTAKKIALDELVKEEKEKLKLKKESKDSI